MEPQLAVRRVASDMIVLDIHTQEFILRQAKSSKAAKEKEKEQPKASATKAKVVVPSPPKAAIPSPPKAAISTLPKPQLDEIATDSDEVSRVVLAPVRISRILLCYPFTGIAGEF